MDLGVRGVLIARGPMLTSGPLREIPDRPSGGSTSACRRGMQMHGCSCRHLTDAAGVVSGAVVDTGGGVFS